VKVNGRVVTELGTKVDPARDKVEVGGKRLSAEEHAYVLLYKPRGYVTTLSDPEGRPTVLELVKSVDVRVYPVGRLDFNSEAAPGELRRARAGRLAPGPLAPVGGARSDRAAKARRTQTC